MAVLTPTANEAINYLNFIAANDLALSDNVGEYRRTECYIRWFGDALRPLSQSASPGIEPLLALTRDELVTLLERRDDLKDARMRLLQSRQEARSKLEEELQTMRRKRFTQLTGNPV